MLVGSIEAGGTKFVCAVGNENLEILEQAQFPTTTPEETLAKVIEFFQKHKVEAIGIGSFGPIEIRENHEKYGYITTTPKKYWGDTDILGSIQQALNIPCSFTTDVNSSAYGELVLSEKKVKSLVYYTIGTGIGGGAIQNGVFIGGKSHAEMGHIFVKRHANDLSFSGVCPFHKDCLEGVASGPTIQARSGIRGEILAKENPTHEVWDILSYYIAQAAVNATLNLAPEKIIFGGGVVSQTLLEKIKEQFVALLNNYVEIDNIEEYLVLPSIENNGSATIGNFALAIEKKHKQ
ncbi:fructokinase [Pilibacter termitis]|uniref:Fructokinase n=1 Tax=Pilibacter termitis TaxID=263852 RepID=A0A1T4MAE9_9ENTE|nr:fructokinase ScrK [Pilibacter termitis]SJZ63922.1 fructokinase [Pilibacter termitis]